LSPATAGLLLSTPRFLHFIAYVWWLKLNVHRVESPLIAQGATMKALKNKSLCAALAAACLAATSLPASAEKFYFGLSINDEVQGHETGLSVYPGAELSKKQKRNSKSDSDGAQVELGFGPWGLKVTAAKLVSNDSPEVIAAYYQRELKQYGNIVDCSGYRSSAKTKEERRAARKERDKDDRPLREQPVACDGDLRVSHSSTDGSERFVYKVGTQADQRIVAVRANTDGSTEFALVHVRVRVPE
jgi:hypothetical protein